MSEERALFPMPDATRVVALDKPCRQLLVTWNVMLDVTGEVGQAGLRLDEGSVFAHHMFERRFSGSIAIIRWAFSDVPEGSHTVQGVGRDIGVRSSRIEATPIYD